MCGIGGFYNALGGEVSLTSRNALLDLWAALEERGNMAAGVALPQDRHTIAIHKSPGPSSRFGPYCWPAVWEPNQAPEWVMLHTRLASHGSIDNNLNNHPLMSGNVVLSHNGVIWNHTHVMRDLGGKAARQVDTEAILRCLVIGGIDKVVKMVRGSYSIAYSDKPGELCLFTNGKNPLVYGKTFTGNYFYASTARLLTATGMRFEYIVDCKPGFLYRFTPEWVTERKTAWQPEAAKAPVSINWEDYAKTGSAGKQTTFKGKKKGKGKKSKKKGDSVTVYEDMDDMVWRRGWRKWRDTY